MKPAEMDTPKSVLFRRWRRLTFADNGCNPSPCEDNFQCLAKLMPSGEDAIPQARSMGHHTIRLHYIPCPRLPNPSSTRRQIFEVSGWSTSVAYPLGPPGPPWRNSFEDAREEHGSRGITGSSAAISQGIFRPGRCESQRLRDHG